MFVMWDVWEVGGLGCWGCEMLEIWDVGDLECSGCSGCGMLIYKMPFDDHIKMVFRKISKTIGLLRKLHNLLPRATLITIYKAFIRPHLDYGDILYDQAYNMSFHQKLESIQYNACLAITGAIRGTSKEKLYQEIGLEPLQLRRWYRKLGIFYKFFKSKSPQYLLR